MKFVAHNIFDGLFWFFFPAWLVINNDCWAYAWGAGQDKGDSTSLQRECSARARSGNSIHASRPFRETIARPKISRNEWKPAERGAFEVGNFALLSCPGGARRSAGGW